MYRRKISKKHYHHSREPDVEAANAKSPEKKDTPKRHA
jgi:hypothetical protein